MNAPFKPVPATHAYSRDCDCESCFEAWLEGAGEKTTAERKDAFDRALALIDATPKREPSEAEIAAAREKADAAVRDLIAPIIRSHRQYQRQFGEKR